MSYFLVVYDRLASKRLRFEEFSDADRSKALDARVSAESAYSNGEVEVVLLTSPSRETLKKTHSRYFLDLNDYSKSA